MTKRSVLLVSGIAIAALGAGAVIGVQLQPCSRVLRSEAEVIRIRGEYAIVIPTSTQMERIFGPSWADLSLYYRCNRGIDRQGREFAMMSGTLLPLAKGAPIVVVSGDRWEDLLILLYAKESGMQATLTVNLKTASVVSDGAARPRPGTAEVIKGGQLILRDPT